MRRKLGEILTEKGAVSQADVDSALSDQSAGEPARLGDMLVALGKVSPSQVAQALSEQYRLPYVDLPAISPEVLAEVPRSFQAAHRMVPFALEGTTLSVAVADPSDSDGMEEVSRTPGRTVKLFVAASDEIELLLAGGLGAPPAPSAAADASALTADDLFSDLALDAPSGIHPRLDAAPAPAHTPPPVMPMASPRPQPVSGARPSPKAPPPGAKPPVKPITGAFPAAGPAPAPAVKPTTGAFPAAGPAPAAKVEPPKKPAAQKKPEPKPSEAVSSTPSTFGSPADPALSTPAAAFASGASGLASSTPSALFELEQAPEAEASKSAEPAGAALALPDWLKKTEGPVAPVAPVPVPVPVATSAVAPGDWSGALDAVAPSKLATAAVRALVKKGLLSEEELQAELESK